MKIVRKQGFCSCRFEKKVIKDESSLSDGDSVIVVKTLNVKDSPLVIKKGTKVKNIRLTDDANEVD